jgi:hypothetical protein
MTKTYNIGIAEFNSTGIRSEAEALGITHMRSIGGGYAEGHEGEADYYVGFYALPHPNGQEFRVANTNGDPVWEEADPQGFAELAESCGVEL